MYRALNWIYTAIYTREQRFEQLGGVQSFVFLFVKKTIFPFWIAYTVQEDFQ